jgi:hypothetical protein
MILNEVWAAFRVPLHDPVALLAVAACAPSSEAVNWIGVAVKVGVWVGVFVGVGGGAVVRVTVGVTVATVGVGSASVELHEALSL